MMEESLMYIYIYIIYICVWRWFHPGFLIYSISFGTEKDEKSICVFFPPYLCWRDVGMSQIPEESFQMVRVTQLQWISTDVSKMSQPCSQSPIWENVGNPSWIMNPKPGHVRSFPNFAHLRMAKPCLIHPTVHPTVRQLGGEPGGGSKLVKLMAPQNKVSLRST